jgi:hypothetical protein
MDHASIVRVLACVARQTDGLIEQAFMKFVADMTAKNVEMDRGADPSQRQAAHSSHEAAMLRFQGSVIILMNLEVSAKRLIAALRQEKKGRDDDVATSSPPAARSDPGGKREDSAAASSVLDDIESVVRDNWC